MSRRYVGYAALVVAGAAFGLGACNAILGIGEATVDPTLEDAGMGGGSTISATTGTGGTGAGGGCEAYCDAIDKNCTGVNAEYISKQVCMSICGLFDPGQPGDTMNDSLACRMHYTELAAADPVTNCQKAGPLAGGGCTEPCSAFCLLAYTLCNPVMQFPYDAGVKDCKTACGAYPYLLSTEADAGAAGDILFLSGDTLNCRLYHLESAFDTTNPNAVTVHCPHTASDSATCN